MESANTPPGWYDDGHGSLRWWDGSQWTTHTAPLAAQPQVSHPQVTQPLAQPQVAQTQATQPQAAQPLTYEQERNLVKVKTSKLWWILPIVLVVAGLVGVLAAFAVWQAADPEPLEETFAAFHEAEQSGDCAALEEVTTLDFREDLVEGDVFSCAAWQSAPGREYSDDVVWGMRFGPMGILVVAEDSPGTTFDGDSTGTVTIYTFVKQDGRWKIDDRDTD